MAEHKDTFQEKTEPATPKKREESRKKGKTVKSMEMNSAFILLFGLLFLYFGGAGLASELSGFMKHIFIHAPGMQINLESAHQLLIRSFITIGVVVGPVALGLLVIGLLVSFSQVGFLVTLEPMKPKFSKFNPIKGIKEKMVSRRAAVELLKNLIKVTVISTVAYFSLKGVIEESMYLMDSDIQSVVGFLAKASLAVSLKVALGFLVLAIFDYAYQRYEHDTELKMTKQEVKEEHKSTEGDPLVKSRIRSVQKQIAYKRMMQDVPTADVIVTNPTHIAVALKYDQGKMGAPKVVAKGAEKIAERIREIAAEHNIPVVEDKFLARTLYKTVEVGEEIPEKLFQAVAEILAYIYRLKQKRT
jgi:flagellar biosynthesis protein FlhB